MVVHLLQLVAGELARLLGSDEEGLSGTLPVFLIQMSGKKELLPASEAVTFFALKLDVLFCPPRAHAGAAHEVARVDFGVMSDRSTGVTLTHPPLVHRSQADELAEHRVQLLDHRRPCWGTGYAPTALSRRF